MINTADERVAKGAKWLDAVRPGWVDEVDLARLNVRECNACVLGQIVKKEADIHSDVIVGTPGRLLYADQLVGYDDLIDDVDSDDPWAVRVDIELLEAVDGLANLVLTPEQAKDRGFHIGRGNPNDNEWENLTEAWRSLIENRRAQ